MVASDVSELLLAQDGVVSRRQLEDTGLAKHDLDRMLRRRELVRVHTGVYVAHTGPLTWRQRAWAAVLAAWPAALVLGSATVPPKEGPIHVAVDATRRIAAPAGVQVHRMRGLGPRVLWHAGPPRLRVEDNTWELVDRAPDELAVIELVTGAVASRRTTPERLRAALDARPRLRHRRLVVGLLEDAAAGTCSVLEHGYLTRVERGHGLPRGHRQRRRAGARGSEYRDVEYTAYGLDIELDGRVGHDGWVAQGRDADRDLDDHADGREAVRLRWRQVFGTPCRTANRIGRILRRRGWGGTLVACGPGCTAV